MSTESFAIGNDELAKCPPLGLTAPCPECGAMLPVQDSKPPGVQYVKCKCGTFTGGIEGKNVADRRPRLLRDWCNKQSFSEAGNAAAQFAQKILDERRHQLNMMMRREKYSSDSYWWKQSEEQEEAAYVELRRLAADIEVQSCPYYICCMSRRHKYNYLRRSMKLPCAVVGKYRDACVVINKNGAWHFPCDNTYTTYELLTVAEYGDLLRQEKIARSKARADYREYLVREREWRRTLRPRQRKPKSHARPLRPKKPSNLLLKAIQRGELTLNASAYETLGISREQIEPR